MKNKQILGFILTPLYICCIIILPLKVTGTFLALLGSFLIGQKLLEWMFD